MVRPTIRALAWTLSVLLLTPALPAAAQDAPSWLEYERPAEHEAVTARNIAVPTRDGSDLSCDLYRPGEDGAAIDGRFPGVVWQFHGYGTNRTYRDSTRAVFLAERGYVVLQCSVRGTGGSPGQWDPFSRQEAEDGYDIVEWLASQEFSTGRIGMAGYSYGAITAYLTAALAPPHLVTIVPQSSYEDAYLDIVRLGGIRGLDIRGWLLGLVLALNATWTPPDQQAALVSRTQEVDEEWASHPLHDGYWDRRRVDHAAVRATGIPILGFGGWYDIYQRGMPANYLALPEQTWLVMEPNAHVGAAYLGTTDRGVLAWLDHWVMQLPGAPLPGARITSHEMPREGGSWVEFDDWQPPGARTERLHFTADGRLAAEPGRPAEIAYDVDQEDGTPSYWNTGTRPDGPTLRSWHTQRESQRVHFATQPLATDLLVAGSITVRMRASFTADDGYLVVRLSDVDPDGTATLVSTGWLQASHRDGHESLSTVTPHESANYEVEVWPTHWRFGEGHRLQMSVSSGDVPRIHPDAPEGTVTIATGTDATFVDLPVLRPAPTEAPSPSDSEAGDPQPDAGAGTKPGLPATGGGLAGVVAALALLVASRLLRTRRP